MSFLSRPGVIAAALTPWTDTGELDLAAFDRQIDWLAEHHPLAISVAGVEVQEYHLLDDDSRVGLVRRTVERLGSVPVVAGVTAPTPDRAADLASRMADVGASGVLALAGPKPWAAPQTSAELVGWFTRLADRSDLPIVVYSNPRTGTEPSVAALAELARHDRIAAVKETSRDMVKVLGLCRDLSAPGRAGVYTNMETLVATMVLGGEGAMVPAPGLPVAARIVRAFERGDLEQARHWQMFFATFPSRWMSLGLGPVVKLAMEVLGVDVGRPLPPFEALGDEARDELRTLLSEWELGGSAVG